jgi:hypothetical protein
LRIFYFVKTVCQVGGSHSYRQLFLGRILAYVARCEEYFFFFQKKTTQKNPLAIHIASGFFFKIVMNTSSEAGHLPPLGRWAGTVGRQRQQAAKGRLRGG